MSQKSWLSSEMEIMKHLAQVLFTSCLITLILTMDSFGEDLKTYQTKYAGALESIHSDARTNIEIWANHYIAAIQTLREKSQSKGELEEVKAVLAEATRFTNTKTLSGSDTTISFPSLKKTQTLFIREFDALKQCEAEKICMLNEKYNKVLTQLQAELTKAGQIDAASSVLDERKKFKPASAVKAEPMNGASITSNNNTLKKKGFILYYPIDNIPDGNVADKSGSGNDGTATDVEWKAEAKGTVGQFNGKSSHIQVSLNKALDPDSDITISLWVKTRPKGWETLVGTDAFRIDVCPDGAFHWDWTDNNNIYTKPGIISLNKWTHLAFVRKSKTLMIFASGKMEFVQSNASSRREVKLLEFGKDGLSKIGGDDYFSGQMDEILVFDRALSSSEIRELSRK